MQDPFSLVAKQVTKTVTAPEGILTLLQDVNLSIPTGKACAILGTSGAGKSTLLGLLAGLDNPSSGEIHLLGQALHQLNEDERAQLRARSIGFVFQSFQLLPHLTALENVMLPLELIAAESIKERAIEVLASVGLEHRLHHTPLQLSGGEQQRVAVARAFVLQPALLFADEPTGNLDQATGAHIIELLFTLQAQHGTTLVLVTHDTQLAQHCSYRYTLNQGILQVHS